MIKPLHDHVVLEVIKKENTTKSGIILTTEEENQATIGKVVAVGPGKYKDGTYLPMHVSVGDKVIFKKYATQEIQLDDIKYLIVNETDILGLI